MNKIKERAIARLGESSTWRGFALIFAASGYNLTADQTNLFIFFGLFISGILGVATKDRGSEK